MRFEPRAAHDRPPLRALLPVLVAVTLAGCGGHASPPPSLHVVIIKQVSFLPAEVMGAVGDTIEWRNQDLVPHTVTETRRTWDSGNVPPDSTWRLVLRSPGAFAYSCQYHTKMHGV